MLSPSCTEGGREWELKWTRNINSKLYEECGNGAPRIHSKNGFVLSGRSLSGRFSYLFPFGNTKPNRQDANK